MNIPIVEHTETLSKYGMALFIYDPKDGKMPIFKIAPYCEGSRVFLEKSEAERLFPFPS